MKLDPSRRKHTTGDEAVQSNAVELQLKENALYEAGKHPDKAEQKLLIQKKRSS